MFFSALAAAAALRLPAPAPMPGLAIGAFHQRERKILPFTRAFFSSDSSELPSSAVSLLDLLENAPARAPKTLRFRPAFARCYQSGMRLILATRNTYARARLSALLVALLECARLRGLAYLLIWLLAYRVRRSHHCGNLFRVVMRLKLKIWVFYDGKVSSTQSMSSSRV